MTYQSFLQIVAGNPPPPLDAPLQIPGPPDDLNNVDVVAVPTLEELGYTDLDEVCTCILRLDLGSKCG